MSENRKRPRSSPAPPLPLELPLADLAAIVERTQTEALTAADHAILKTAMATLAFLMAERQAKKTSLERLRRMLFGAKTETTRAVLRGQAGEDRHAPDTGGTRHRDGGLGDDVAGGRTAKTQNPKPKAQGPRPKAQGPRPKAQGPRPKAQGPRPKAQGPRPKAQGPRPKAQGPRPKAQGHGRNGASAYTGAEQVMVAHPDLHSGDACPRCMEGTLYLQNEPGKLVRITGMAPLSATVSACDRLRCHLCGEVTTAPAPEGVGPEKYDATATSMVGLLKYGAGLPFNRIETLQAGMRIPLPAATQWDLVRKAAPVLAPAHAELLRQAGQAPVLYNDDTTMKVLQLTKAQRAAALADCAHTERTGIFTSGIVATEEGRQIALFFYRGPARRRESGSGVSASRSRFARPHPDVRWPVAQRPQRSTR